MQSRQAQAAGALRDVHPLDLGRRERPVNAAANRPITTGSPSSRPTQEQPVRRVELAGSTWRLVG